jgi:hypothetical protein
VRRPAALLALLSAAAVLLLKRSKAQRTERALWTEAADLTGAAAPDLR